MIDSLTIFSRAGTVLYSYSPSSSDADDEEGVVPVDTLNTLISTVLLEERHATDKTCTVRPPGGSGATPPAGGGNNALIAEWEEGGLSGSKRKDWVAVVLYREVLRNRLGHVRGLLRSSLHEYALFHESVVARGGGDDAVPYLIDDPSSPITAHIPPKDPSVFNPTFRALLRKAEKSKRTATASGTDRGSGGGEQGDESDDFSLVDEEDGREPGDDGGDESMDTAEGLARLRERRGHAADRSGKGGGDAPERKKGKEKTVWHDGTGKVTKSALKDLDRSKRPDGGGDDAADTVSSVLDVDDSRALQEARAAYLPSPGEIPSWEEEETLRDDDVAALVGDDRGGGGGWAQSFKSFVDQISGNKILADEDLDPILEEMKQILVSKNVANDIASEICDGVRSTLVGRRLQSFGRIGTAVRVALEAAVARILTPHRNVDVLREVLAKREAQRGSDVRRPYVIVMVGINGVGKSTSLAKIAYYLKSSGCNPILAACDTFRSGAVEQLAVHAKCLEVPLFQKGYAKDPSSVARAAISHASNEGNDVVLVDTAGRMQNNVPLMKALSKLVTENRPDLVLFVGEALVGNDGIDQLKMFDQALRTGGHDRNIDGIVLTKFDTVSDKVGAALTMTHITGQPVVFVGTGQKYNHLKKLSVPSVIKSLFS